MPYPVQLIGTELMLEFIGDWETGEAAPRLAQVRADPDALADLWRQMTDALSVLARAQVAHGDLSPYNTLVHDGRLVLIDLPQIVDVVANPQGADFIARDVRNVAAWFTARGLRGRRRRADRAPAATRRGCGEARRAGPAAAAEHPAAAAGTASLQVALDLADAVGLLGVRVVARPRGRPGAGAAGPSTGPGPPPAP